MARRRRYRIQTYDGEVLADPIIAESKRQALAHFADRRGDHTSLSRLALDSRGVGSDPEYRLDGVGLVIAKEVTS